MNVMQLASLGYLLASGNARPDASKWRPIPSVITLMKSAVVATLSAIATSMNQSDRRQPSSTPNHSYEYVPSTPNIFSINTLT